MVATTMAAVSLTELLRMMRPVRQPGAYVFVSVSGGADVAALDPVATFREPEGLSIIVAESVAEQAGLVGLFRAAWITLMVHSDLQAVGLTAAVAAALTEAGISCNVVAAAYHDHLFVPYDAADQAVAVLQRLQASAG